MCVCVCALAWLQVTRLVTPPLRLPTSLPLLYALPLLHLLLPPLPYPQFPHGGPHSSFSTAYSASPVLLALSGFVVAMVNYRGSIGKVGRREGGRKGGREEVRI